MLVKRSCILICWNYQLKGVVHEIVGSNGAPLSFVAGALSHSWLLARIHGLANVEVQGAKPRSVRYGTAWTGCRSLRRAIRCPFFFANGGFYPESYSTPTHLDFFLAAGCEIEGPPVHRLRFGAKDSTV